MLYMGHKQTQLVVFLTCRC